MKKDYLEIPLDKLRDITYTNPDREPDQLEWSFISTIAKETGFFMRGINISKASKSRYSRNFDYFEFEFEGKQYILNKGKLKEGTN